MKTESKPKWRRWQGMIWYLYYQFIDWQIQKRNNNDIEVQEIHPSLNISIIASCCSVIEGFLFTLIKNYILFSLPTDDTGENLKEIYYRQIEDYSEQLENASYSRYVKLFKVFTGMSINEVINPETTKAIKCMFDFRNCLLHGNEIDIIYPMNKSAKLDEVKVLGKYMNILKYGNEKNLIVLDFENSKIDLHTNEFIDHFHDHTTKYICELYDSIPEEYRKKLNFDIFRIKENLK